ncbi:MAG: 30S ribosomal protein S20 [Chloroflexi bacterium]|nr:MAG: 30S ribosomal protein S20 [Chloroflexota bacterium]
MAHTKSAKKTIRSSKRRQSYNKPIRSRVKTYLTKAEEVISSGNMEVAIEVVRQAISKLDKAAKRGIIHRNKAARHKSRLMKKLNALLSTSST